MFVSVEERRSHLDWVVYVYTVSKMTDRMNIVKSHKWAARADEMLDLADRIADEVARDIEVELIVGEPAGLYAELDDPDAIEHVYLGWYHLRTDTVEGWNRALEHFGAVAESHPDQPYGYVLTAFGLWLGAANGWVADSAEALRREAPMSRLPHLRG